MSASSAEPVFDVASTDAPVGPDPKRWLALWVIAIAQLMVVLDASIVNIALPSAQHALHISDANRQWVVTAYTLAFGGLLLLGGRIADYVGRKRAFIIGLLGFARRLGPRRHRRRTGGELFAARALQGAFAALLAPAALSLITVTFTEPQGAGQGLRRLRRASPAAAPRSACILGGVLTEYASWRWSPARQHPDRPDRRCRSRSRCVRESRADGNTHYDIPACRHGDRRPGRARLRLHQGRTPSVGWTAGVDRRRLLAGRVVLLVAFVVIENRTRTRCCRCASSPNRNRGRRLPRRCC